jgi:uncharacterized damage-inducible protein DinB
MKNETLPAFISPNDFLNHWQGHRSLTRKVIEAFPEDKLFNYSVGGMRPFSELALEMIHMAVPSVAGIITGEWKTFGESEAEEKPTTKTGLLQLWDESTEKLNELFPQIKIERFQEVEKAFGQYEGTNYALIFYCIDNEIHHRGQGYVYLRSLGIEPPFFWERGKVEIQDVG